MTGSQRRSFPWTRALFLPLVLGAFLLAGPHAPLGAQDPPKAKFFLSPKATPVDAEKFQASIQVRPNSSVGFHVFVSSKDVLSNAWVEMRDRDNNLWARTGPMKFEVAGQDKEVIFLKPEEKKPAAAPAPAPAAAAASAPPAAPPPPPGRSLAFTKPPSSDKPGSFGFVLRLMTEKPDKTLDEVARAPLNVVVLNPREYLDQEATAEKASISVKVTAKSDDTGKKAFLDGSPSVVTLYFPSGENIDVKHLGSGTYRRTLSVSGTSVTLEAKDLPILRDQNRDAIRFYLEADGYTRAFVYQPRLRTAGSIVELDRNTQLQTSDAKAVRLYPGQAPVESANKHYYARPVAKADDRYPVRVELDNVADYSQTLVTFGTTAVTSSDVSVLYGARDVKVWIDPAGEEGKFLITNKLTDWVAPLDTYMLRGDYTLTAKRSERTEGSERPDAEETRRASLLLDDTGPDRIALELPDEHIKGTPLQVHATVSDRENTPITRVVFFIGLPPGPDGKRPADPIKVEGARLDQNRWIADLPLAPDAKGVLQVGATATNEVGLDSTETKNIRLLEPPAPAGEILVKVERGGRPQPGVRVLLKDAEGKEKSVLTTDKKGEAKFEHLAPGMYGVGSAKADSSSGSKAALAVKVEAGKTSDVTLDLKRGPPTK